MNRTNESSAPIRGAFPISIGTLVFMAVAGLVISKTISDSLFHAQTEPVVVKTLEAALSLEENRFVEIDLALDTKEKQKFKYGFSDDLYLVVPFKGTGRKLIYVLLIDPKKDDAELLKPPLIGRTVAKDFDDTWNLGSSRDAKLNSIFPGGLPEGAIVVRPEIESGVSWWQWFLTVIAVLFLIWVFFVLVMWLLGRDVLAEEQTVKAS